MVKEQKMKIKNTLLARLGPWTKWVEIEVRSQNFFGKTALSILKKLVTKNSNFGTWSQKLLSQTRWVVVKKFEKSLSVVLVIDR